MPTDFNAFSRNLLRTFEIESYYQENRCGKDRLILEVFSILKNKGQVHKQWLNTLVFLDNSPTHSYTTFVIVYWHKMK